MPWRYLSRGMQVGPTIHAQSHIPQRFHRCRANHRPELASHPSGLDEHQCHRRRFCQNLAPRCQMTLMRPIFVQSRTLGGRCGPNPVGVTGGRGSRGSAEDAECRRRPWRDQGLTRRRLARTRALTTRSKATLRISGSVLGGEADFEGLDFWTSQQSQKQNAKTLRFQKCFRVPQPFARTLE